VELRHLRYFIAVAEELHYGRAAARLHMAQSPLSRAIIDLEHELGVRLLDRTTRGVRLTETGALFLVEARKTVAQAEKAAAVARASVAAARPRLRLGFPEYANETVLPAAVRLLQKRHADIEVELHELYTPVQIAAVQRGDLDVGFVYAPAVEDGELGTQTLAELEFGVLLPAGHPLADLETIPFARLERERFLVPDREHSPAYHDDVLGWCRQAGFEPDVAVQHVYSRSTSARLITSGVGVLLGRWSQLPAGVVHRALRDPTPVFTFALAWRADNEAPAVAALIEAVRELRRKAGR
jgi:DNA-binding transcriptional LysR family regulator